MNGRDQDVIMLGDSLTERAAAPGGFGSLLSAVYVRKLDVLNRGFREFNTVWTLPVFKRCLVKRSEATPHNAKIRLLIIWLGANDAALPSRDQHVPLPEFSENLSKIIHTVTSPSSEYYAPQTKVILLTPPPVNGFQRAAALQCDRDFATTEEYAEAVRRVAKKENIPLVDVHSLLWEGCGKDEEKLTKYLTDGLHVNQEAYQLIFQGLMKVISEHFPELHYDNTQLVFPA